MLGILVIIAGCAFVPTVMRPAFGAYLLLFATPLIAGVARGSIPLRPNEMLLLLVMAALATRVLLLMLSRRYHPGQFDRIDAALLALATAGSVMPVLWRLLRDLPLSVDDLLYSFVLIKYYALFRVFRASVVTVRQVTVCLWLSMTSAVLVAIVALLQVLNLFGVPEFLLTYYDLPYDTPTLTIDHGTSTLASAFGFADLMIMNLIIALTVWRTARRRWLLLPAAVVFLCGCILSGEFSAYIGLVAAVLAFTSLYGSTVHRTLPMLSAAGIVIVASFWPVIAHRFDSFSDQQSMPTAGTHVGTTCKRSLSQSFSPERLASGCSSGPSRPRAGSVARICLHRERLSMASLDRWRTVPHCVRLLRIYVASHVAPHRPFADRCRRGCRGCRFLLFVDPDRDYAVRPAPYAARFRGSFLPTSRAVAGAVTGPGAAATCGPASIDCHRPPLAHRLPVANKGRPRCRI